MVPYADALALQTLAELLGRNLEDEKLCTCYNVSENEVRRVIVENQLTTVEEVTNFTKAGGGCGRCKVKIQAMLDEINGGTK